MADRPLKGDSSARFFRDRGLWLAKVSGKRIEVMDCSASKFCGMRSPIVE
jgi:hypothetical protein